VPDLSSDSGSHHEGVRPQARVRPHPGAYGDRKQIICFLPPPNESAPSCGIGIVFDDDFAAQRLLKLLAQSNTTPGQIR
jgi:hypothetical protein